MEPVALTEQQCGLYKNNSIRRIAGAPRVDSVGTRRMKNYRQDRETMSSWKTRNITAKMGGLSNKRSGKTEEYNNNNGRNGSFFYVAGYLIEERRRWPVITASPRGQSSK